MSRFWIILLWTTFATALNLNLTTIYEWNVTNFEWPSERDKEFAPEQGRYDPRFMAVFGSRLFLSLLPSSLVWLPINATSTSPKFNPMPSWEMQFSGDCEAMQAVRGLQVDTVGRLWVLDNGRSSTDCPPKLWIFDLNKNDSVVLVHAFPRDFYYSFSERGKLHDLVLDRTKNDWLAYIASPNARNLVVFSFKRNASWVVKSSVVFWRQISGVAISPGTRARLYFFQFDSNKLFSVSVSDLRARKEDPAVRLEFSGTSISRMVMDAEGVLYFDLGVRKSLFKWNTSNPFKEERLLKDVFLVRDTPFTFTLDEQGNFWITKQYENKMPQYKMLKADIGVKSYLYDALTGCSSSNETCDYTEIDDSPTFSWDFEISPEGKTIFIIVLICLNVAIAVSLGTVIYCLLQKGKKIATLI